MVRAAVSMIDDTEDLRHQTCGLGWLQFGLAKGTIGVVKCDDHPESAGIARYAPEVRIDTVDGRAPCPPCCF